MTMARSLPCDRVQKRGFYGPLEGSSDRHMQELLPTARTGKPAWKVFTAKGTEFIEAGEFQVVALCQTLARVSRSNATGACAPQKTVFFGAPLPL